METPAGVKEVEALIREIQRYLGFLDALRKRTEPPDAEPKRKSG